MRTLSRARVLFAATLLAIIAGLIPVAMALAGESGIPLPK